MTTRNATTHIAIRIPDDLWAAVDVWRERQIVTPSKTATITEALRQFIGQSRCTVVHPVHPELQCALPLGHEGNHWCSGLEWNKGDNANT